MEEKELYKILDLENLENEEWLPVVGYEGLYEVSNMGRIKSLGNNKSRKEKILKQIKFKSGYLRVGLSINKTHKLYQVHRLVANAFIPNPNNYTTVNHKNEIKTDNRVENLEWMNMKQQVNYGTCIQRRVASRDYKSIAEKLSRQVYQYTKDGTLVAIWESTRECERSGYIHSAISECCNGKLKSHRGYLWSYTELIC